MPRVIPPKSHLRRITDGTFEFMTDSLRDQLLNLGFKPPAPAAKPMRPAAAARGPQGRADGDRRKDAARPSGKPVASVRGTPPVTRPSPSAAHAPRKPNARPAGPGKPRAAQEMDLARAYAIRAQKEKQDRIAAEAARQEEARRRREARAVLGEFLKDKALNVPDAEIARHFPYGGKIKRIYVTAPQLTALNAGELGVLQLDGRYVLVEAEVLTEGERIFPQALALRVDPDAPVADDPYADPLYTVPDDLVW